MKLFTKIVITCLCTLLAIGIIYGLLRAFSTNYFSNASFLTSGLVILAAVVGIALLFMAAKGVWNPIWLLLIIPFFQACNYAKSNQQVLISDDCGVVWKKIDAGESVPKGTMNPCYVKVVVPNYPMQGESKFVSNFAEKVRATIHIDYDYSITNGLSFIKQAKSLGRGNSDADDDLANSSAFESAENSVIDKRLKDVTKRILQQENIVDADQADLESVIQVEANKILEPLGVSLNFITLTFDLDEQARQAIDVATAMKIYESKNLTEVGKSVMAARAGATKIAIENKTAAPVAQ